MIDVDLQNSLLNTCSIIADNAASASAADKTIECQIIDAEKADEGIYKVQYTENYFTAYSTNGFVYKEEDYVYILVPQGDFNKNKIILGKSQNFSSFVPIPSQEPSGEGDAEDTEPIPALKIRELFEY